MFELGLTLESKDFMMVLQRPKAVFAGMAGQLVLLPLIACGVASLFDFRPEFFIGLVLIACCPGGSSSNVFSMLAKGDVALSVSLTAVSSIITLFTLPVIMSFVTSSVGDAVGITLPVGKLLMQNVVTMLVPLLLGFAVRRWKKDVAARIDGVLSRLAFPALMFLAAVFFVQNKEAIIENVGQLGMAVTGLLLCAIALAAVLCVIFRLQSRERRTIVIEVGMQNAAQAIMVATSPLVFNNDIIAIPAIIYALMMNIVLLIYVGIIKYKK